MYNFKKIIKYLFWFSLFSAGSTVLGMASIYLYLSPNLPSVASIKDVKFQTPLRIYSADDKLIGEFGEKRLTPISLEQVPKSFIDALLAAEDAQFYSHNGVSIKGLLRAVSQIITTGKKGSGGSTLTMQLTRNIFLTLDQTFTRKFNEILLALKIEKELSKDEILELYVNYMFLGKRAYGINSAAQVYYGKPLNELSLAQLAMIAGLFQGPSTQNPIVNPERAVERRNWILGRMLELGYITEDDYISASEELVTAKYHESKFDAYTPYVAELAREKTIRSFGLDAYTNGYKVYTTIDSKNQLAAQNAVAEGLISYDLRHGYRGAEQTISIPKPETTPEENTDNNNENTSKELPYVDIINNLRDIPDYGNLTVAAVLDVSEDNATAITKDGNQIQLPLETALKWARPYISEDARGPSPKSATEVLKPGDVIRVRMTNGEWHLSQIPDAQAALVALNPLNGAIISIVGGFDFNHSHFNRATQALRQPGSNFKPFIYTSALENGMTAATLINDAPVVFNDNTLENTWRPENDSGKFYGPTRLRKALYLSRNLVSIRVLQSVGINPVIKTIEKFGFETDNLPKDLSLALGSHALSPMDIAAGYAVFANGGYKVSPHLISKIVDVDNNVIYQAYPDTVCEPCQRDKSEPSQAQQENNDDPDFTPDPFTFPLDIKSRLNILTEDDFPPAPRAIDERTAFIMDSILQDVVQRGTGRKALSLGRSDLAGKTGTTNGPTDLWFSGYNNNLVASVWVGLDRNTPLGKNEFGSTTALPIWMTFMEAATKDTPNTIRKQPQGVISMRINPTTGKRARATETDAVFEYFRVENTPEEGTEPAQLNDYNQTEQTVTEEIF